jgi:hypothetical protein
VIMAQHGARSKTLTITFGPIFSDPADEFVFAEVNCGRNTRASLPNSRSAFPGCGYFLKNSTRYGDSLERESP